MIVMTEMRSNMIKKGIDMMKVTYVQKEVDEVVYYDLEDEINNGIEETINLENNIDNLLL